MEQAKLLNKKDFYAPAKEVVGKAIRRLKETPIPGMTMVYQGKKLVAVKEGGRHYNILLRNGKFCLGDKESRKIETLDQWIAKRETEEAPKEGMKSNWARKIGDAFEGLCKGKGAKV